MPSRIVIGFVVFACMLPVARPQDRDTYAREYVQFQVTELDQWSKDFPQAYNMALMRPPVDAAKLTEPAKAGATALRDSITRMVALSSSKDLITNAEFRAQLNKCFDAVKDMNQAFASQRFPEAVYGDWNNIRSNLNNLARIYKLDQIAVLDPPVSGAGRSGPRGQQAAARPPAGALVGYIVDQQCAKRGKGMWTNTACVERCIREGDKVVLVTEEGKIYQIANLDKIETDTYGQRVTVTGKVDGDTVTVASLQM